MKEREPVIAIPEIERESHSGRQLIHITKYAFIAAGFILFGNKRYSQIFIRLFIYLKSNFLAGTLHHHVNRIIGGEKPIINYITDSTTVKADKLIARFDALFGCDTSAFNIFYF